MKFKAGDSSSEQVKRLTESEIQEKLYGIYLGKRAKAGEIITPQGSHPGKGPPLYKSDVHWTGVEILSGELKRLRRELLALREEKERLAQELDRRETIVMPPPTRPIRWLGKSVWIFLLLSGIAYPVGIRFLQASPMTHEVSPYTVQVAVYNVKPSAEKALEFVQELGYDAFLVETPYRNRSGKTKYHLYVGRFVTKQEADMERTRLVSDPHFSDAFVRLQ